MEHIGHRVWAIPEGFIPDASTGPESMASQGQAATRANGRLGVTHLAYGYRTV